MPTKRCLIKSCKAKECIFPYFRIPSVENVGENVLKIWLDNLDKDRKVIGDPLYGICSRHFAGKIENIE